MNKDLYTSPKITQKVEQSYQLDTPLVSKEEAMDFIVDLMHDLDREAFICVNLDDEEKPINFTINHLGGLDQSIVSPREVFKSAILSNAHSMLLMHNHPSGSTSFSPADYTVTSILEELGAYIGIQINNHCIFTPSKQLLMMKADTSDLNNQISFNFRTSGSMTFESVGIRQINFDTENRFVINTLDDLKKFTQIHLKPSIGTHVLFSNTIGEVMSIMNDINITQIDSKEVISNILRQAIVSNTKTMFLITEDPNLDLEISNFKELINISVKFKMPLQDVICLSDLGDVSLRSLNPYKYEALFTEETSLFYDISITSIPASNLIQEYDELNQTNKKCHTIPSSIKL